MTRKAAIGMVRAGALAAAFFLAGGAIPIVGVIVTMFAPLPVLGYAAGRPLTMYRATGSVVLAAGLVALAAGPKAALGFLASFGLVTATICYLLGREERFELIVLTAVALLLGVGVAAGLALAGSPAALAAAVHDGIGAGLARSQDFYRMFGLDATLEADTRERLLDLTTRLAPALAAVVIAASVLVNLVVFWRWMGKGRLSYQLFGDLVRWHAPEWLVWVLLATGFSLFVPIGAVRTAALDAFICVAAVYFCQGAAIMAFYFRMLGMPVPVRAIIYLVAVLQPVLAAIVSAVGLFDMWIDFRRLKPPSQEAGSFGDFF